MSLVALPFAVDINKVRSIFGSKDRALLENIKTANLYYNYASQSDDLSIPGYQYNFDQALEDIIFNYVRPEDRKARKSFLGLIKQKSNSGLNEKIAHGYGYVLLVVCDYLGTHLLPQCDGFYYGRDFEASVDIMKEKGLQLDLGDMFEQHDVFDIPISNDFPAIKLFSKEEIEHIDSVMGKVEIDENQADLDEVQEMLKNIRDSFRTCKEKNTEMITFTH